MTPAARAGLGAGLAALSSAALDRWPPGGRDRWLRTNHRGAPVSLLSGPVLSAAAACSSIGGAAAAVAGLGAAAVGGYDDVAGQRPEQRSSKGLRGHAEALRRGRVTAGAVKVAGIGASGLAAAAVAGSRGRDLLLDAALIAGTANLLNLFDLRPGRALKVGLGGAVVLADLGPAAAAAVLLPSDLHEQTMLGDAGANGLGAVLGVVLAQRLPARRARGTALASVVALTAASEVVSFTRVIDAVPPLRWVDRLGRLR